MKIISKTSLFFLLGCTLSLNGWPLDYSSPHQQSTYIDQESYQDAANDVITAAFTNSKDLYIILQKLLVNTENKFLETWNQTRVSYKDHVFHFITALLQETLKRYTGSRSKFSVAKESIWGQSNTLVVLGVLKNAATDLQVALPLEVDTQLKTALSYLHFYTSKIDMRGTKGFDFDSGKFTPLPPEKYPDVGHCIEFTKLIVEEIKKNEPSQKPFLNKEDLKRQEINNNNNLNNINNNRNDYPADNGPEFYQEPKNPHKKNANEPFIPQHFQENYSPHLEEQAPKNQAAPILPVPELIAKQPSNSLDPLKQQENNNHNPLENPHQKLLVVPPPNANDIDRTYMKGIFQLAKEYDLGTFLTIRGDTHWVTINEIPSLCKIKRLRDPERYRKNTSTYKNIQNHAPLPPGEYALSDNCPSWIQVNPEQEQAARRFQGIKLHVSAKPKTALKIAQLVLPILNQNKVIYKVMYSLSIMRYIYYLSQYDSPQYLVGDNKSSQAGKFIAIYPTSLEQAQSIIQQIENVFQAEGLALDDFEPLAGDAQIGESGGIFARYGKFSNQSHKGRDALKITPVDMLDNSIPFEMLAKEGIPYDPNQGMVDERTYPWPDYMNNRNLYPGSLFGNLSVKWVNPYNPEQVITWENRPNCWAEIQGKACHQEE